MALSGSSYTAFKDHRLVIEWSATQSIPNNNSSVTARVYLQGMQSWSTLYAPANNNGSITVNGSTQYFTANSNLTGTQKKLLATKTFSVGHAANGTKTFSFSTTYNVNVNYNGYVGNVTASGSGTLNTIPRATGIKVNTPSFNYGGNLGFALTQAIAGFTYRVDVNIAGWTTSATYNGTGGAGNKTINIPVSWAQRVPNATQTGGSITVTTLNGSSSIGTASGSFTTIVGPELVPTVTSFAISEANPKVSALLPSGNYLQSISDISYTGAGAGVQGSTIASITATVGKVSNVGGSGKLSLSRDVNIKGTVPVTLTVRDSRNRSASSTQNILIVEYNAPVITSVVGNRSDNGKGGSVIIQRTGSISPVTVNGKALNKIASKVEHKITTATAWTTSHSSADFGNVTINNIGVIYSYDFRVTLSDSFSSVSATATFAIPTAKTLLHLNEDIGIGIGAMHERGVLDVTGDSYFAGRTDMKGNNYLDGYSKISGTNLDLEVPVRLDNSFTLTGNESTIKLPMNRNMGVTGVKASFNANNSDIIGLNGLYFRDETDAHGEGLMFPRKGVTVPDDSIPDNKWPNWDNLRVLNGEVLLNGDVVALFDSVTPLWEGGMYMTAGHTVKPSRHLQGCPNGWILQWSAYANGAVQNYNYNYTVVHKGQWKTANGSGTYHTMSNTQSSSCGKYLYIANDSIAGHANNNAGTSGSFVLRRVFAF